MSERKTPTMGERLAILETELHAHVKSCDFKSSVMIALGGVILAASLTGTGVLLRAALHIAGG